MHLANFYLILLTTTVPPGCLQFKVLSAKNAAEVISAIKKLNLTRFVSELVQSFLDCKFHSADIVPAVEVRGCCVRVIVSGGTRLLYEGDCEWRYEAAV